MKISADIFLSLTLGLMGLDELHLRVLATSSEDLTQRRNAQKGPDDYYYYYYSSVSIDYLETVLKLMQKGRHWVLVVRLAIFIHILMSVQFFFKGSSTGQCRKYVYFECLKPEFMIIL